MTAKARRVGISCCEASTPGVSNSSPQHRVVGTVPGKALRRSTLVAAVASAFAASICCIGPMAAALLGFTGLGAAARFHSLRPYLTVVTLLFLVVAFYLTYRGKPAAACEPGSLCATAEPGRMGRLNRGILWVVAAVSFLVLAFPTWSGWIWR